MQVNHSRRLLSLDVFRGLTVALMIIVNSPGNAEGFALLNHAIWHGCTLADLVFPFFILIAGTSAALTLANALKRGQTKRSLIIKIAKRSAWLFLIGLLLNAFPHHFDPASLRIMGVLQRIALCYFLSSLLYLALPVGWQLLVTLVLLVGYYLAICYIPVPGYGAGDLSMAGNLAAYVDQWLIPSAHLYTKGFDPEGLFSTIPALATALLGNLLGSWLLSLPQTKSTVKILTLVGAAMAGLGWLWGLFFPINKALWTSSYVLWTGGLAFVVFAACYWLVELGQYRRLTKPLQIFGVNALLAFVLHVVFLKLQVLITLTNNQGQLVNLKTFITQQLFAWVPPNFASLFYAFSYMLLWLVVIYYWSHRQQASNRADKLDTPQPHH